MKRFTAIAYRRRSFLGLTITGSVLLIPVPRGRSEGKDPVDVKGRLEEARIQAEQLLDEITKEPLPLAESTVQSFLNRDLRLRTDLARALSLVEDEELRYFILPNAVALVELAEVNGIPLVPAVEDFPKPELKPNFPLPSPTAPRDNTFEDRDAFETFLKFVLVLAGFDPEAAEQLVAPFRMSVDETPGANEKIDGLLSTARLGDWVGVARQAAEVALIFFAGSFIIRFGNAVTRELGEAAGKAVAQTIIKGATLRFVPFVGPAYTSYRIVLALKLLRQRFQRTRR